MKDHRFALGVLACLAAASAACFEAGDLTFGPDDDDDLLQVGTIVATTNTTGPSPDPNGYVVRLDEARSQPIDTDGSVTFSSLKVGTYDVTLEQFEPNCFVAGTNPVYILLQQDSIRQAHFDVVCN